MLLAFFPVEMNKSFDITRGRQGPVERRSSRLPVRVESYRLQATGYSRNVGVVSNADDDR